MSNEKETTRAAKEVVCNWGAIRGENASHAIENVTVIIRSTVEAALATVRGEERKAAFKDAAGIARAMASGETFETGRQKALNIAAALEAAAENRKGEG